MAKRKRNRRRPKPATHIAAGRGSLDPARTRRGLIIGLRVMAVSAVLAGGALGLWRLDTHVHAKPRFAGPPELVLLGVPDGLEPVIQQGVNLPADLDWSDPRLCALVGRQLEAIAWVRTVESVRRFPTGRLEARCVYRTPTTLVQSGGEFVLIDEECVRLPGRYPYRPSWPLIQGVSSVPPAPGQVWKSPDLAAAVALLDCLGGEAFRDQVTAVQVHNYRGRIDARAAHIELATDRAGGRIIWGSAPGEEVEENSAAQKVAILRRNHQLHGRIDAGRRVIDITTFPDRFTTPSEAAARHQDLAGRQNPA